MTYKRLFCAAVSAMAISAFMFANQANATLVYDLRVASATTGEIGLGGKTLKLNTGLGAGNSATLQLWGVIDDGGAVGFQDDILIGGTLNIVAKNKVGNGAISATSGVTAAAFPTAVQSGGNFNSAGSTLGLGGANAFVRTSVNPGVVADVPTAGASADGLDWGSDENYITVPPTNPIALAAYQLQGAGTTPQRSYSWALGAGSGMAAGTPIVGFSQPGVGANAGKWEVLLGTFTVTLNGTKLVANDETSIAPFSYQRFRPTSTSGVIPGMNYSQGASVFGAGQAINEATQLSGVSIILIPEPSTYALIALGMGALAWSRRRKVAA